MDRENASFDGSWEYRGTNDVMSRKVLHVQIIIKLQRLKKNMSNLCGIIASIASVSIGLSAGLKDFSVYDRAKI